MKIVDQIIQSLRENKIILVGGVLLTVYSSVQALIEPIKHPVWSDIVLLLLLIGLGYGTMRACVLSAMLAFQFAKKRLRVNAYIYMIRETWPSFLIAGIILGAGLLTFASGPVRALADHIRFDREPARYCLRVAAECRGCPSLLDIAGRPTGPKCLRVDPGGLSEGHLDRWNAYRAHSGMSECSSQTVTKLFSQEEFNTCRAYLGP